VEFNFLSELRTHFTLFRPSIVSRMPNVTRSQPILIAPVNFLGAADATLHFNLMGESGYSRYWMDYPLHLTEPENPALPADPYEVGGSGTGQASD